MVYLNLNTDNGKQLEFLKNIKDTQVQLFRPGIEGEFPEQEQKNKFLDYRLKWSDYVQKVEINIATVLVNQLKQNELELKAGIEAIDKENQRINNAVDFLKVLDRTLGILGRIIPLTL
ncbi:MAG: hypothetical protein ACYTXI_39485 [Nostoc sp.]